MNVYFAYGAATEAAIEGLICEAVCADIAAIGRIGDLAIDLYGELAMLRALNDSDS